MSSATLPKRGTPKAGSLDLYETPAAATRALIGTEQLPHLVWEPACGRLAITRELEAAGHSVVSSDIKIRPAGRAPRGRRFRHDFFAGCPEACDGAAIVSNPPFNRADEFIAVALDRSSYVAMLLRLGYLEGGAGNTGDAAFRRFVLDERPPTTILVFSRRLPMMHREGWTGPKAGSGQAYAWFIWDYRRRGHLRSGSLPAVRRVDWRPFATNHAVGKPAPSGGKSSNHDKC